ncbi:MAG: hypothetical protein LZF62_230114 [Nitrospira sp.]|nr:MAG: hypothetical protein LZF62_230114 [Nitrospira sp.]
MGGTGRGTAFISLSARLAVSFGEWAVVQAVSRIVLNSTGTIRESFMGPPSKPVMPLDMSKRHR